MQIGSSGAELTKRLDEITLYDIYKAVGSIDTEEGLFHFHEQPNPDCPVGRNIHNVLDQRLIDAQRAIEKNSNRQRLPISWKIQGRQSTMNEDWFVEDEGWHTASQSYSDFLLRHKNMKVLFLETAVGWNTPGIVKFAFWQMTNEWPDATYACLNYSESDLFDPTISG